MTKWTYKAVFLTPTPLDRTGLDAWLAEMNAYGAEGWEAFTIIPQESGWWTVFRRATQTESRRA